MAGTGRGRPRCEQGRSHANYPKDQRSLTAAGNRATLVARRRNRYDTAAVMRSAIAVSTAGVHLVSAKETGHMSP